jgi:hypothetical protein
LLKKLLPSLGQDGLDLFVEVGHPEIEITQLKQVKVTNDALDLLQDVVKFHLVKLTLLQLS